MEKLIYLACPYSKPPEEPKRGHGVDRTYMRLRAHDASRAALLLMRDGYAVFSPISHGHMICREAWAFGIDMGVTIDAWRPIDTAMIRACDEMFILTLPGWEDSEGIKEEIEYARNHGKPISLVSLVEPGLRLEVTEYREAA